MPIPLLNERKITLLHQRDKTRDQRVCDRMKSIIHDRHGWSTSEITVALVILESTTQRHIQTYLNDKKRKPEHDKE